MIESGTRFSVHRASSRRPRAATNPSACQIGSVSAGPEILSRPFVSFYRECPPHHAIHSHLPTRMYISRGPRPSNLVHPTFIHRDSTDPPLARRRSLDLHVSTRTPLDRLDGTQPPGQRTSMGHRIASTISNSGPVGMNKHRVPRADDGMHWCFLFLRAVSFLPEDLTMGFTFLYTTLTLHALTPASPSGVSAHLYCQLDESDAPSSDNLPTNGNGNGLEEQAGGVRSRSAGLVNGDDGEVESTEVPVEVDEHENEFTPMRELRIYLAEAKRMSSFFPIIHHSRHTKRYSSMHQYNPSLPRYPNAPRSMHRSYPAPKNPGSSDSEMGQTRMRMTKGRLTMRKRMEKEMVMAVG